MNVTHRLANLRDADRLFEIRRQSIIALAPNKLSVAEAEAWAGTLTVPGMVRKIRELEIWVAEIGGVVVGWGAVRANQLEGLYTDPKFFGRGVATELLRLLEGLMRTRGISVVCAEASSNAEEFYLQRGYKPIGLRTPQGGQLISKLLL